MMKFERNKLDEAIVCAGRMAAGRDPVTGLPVKNEVFDNVNVVRSLCFVESVLKETAEFIDSGTARNSRETKMSGPKKEFPFEVLSLFRYSNDKSVSFVLKQFAEPVAEENVKKPNPAAVNKWLEKNGYIEKRIIPESGRECWFPCQKGIEAGLYTKEHGDPAYRYTTVIYSQKAQYFLADNLETIMKETRSAQAEK